VEFRKIAVVLFQSISGFVLQAKPDTFHCEITALDHQRLIIR